MVISSIICDYVIYVITVMLTGRMIWSMSQKYLLVHKATGQIVTNGRDYELITREYSQVAQEADNVVYGLYNAYFDSDTEDEGDIYQEHEEDGLDDQDHEHWRIRIRVLPKFINKIWSRTGSPIYGILIQAIISAIICFVQTNYHLWTEFLMFMYLFSFLLIIFAFLILKYTEPDLVRQYQVPGKKMGAWIVSLLCISCILCIGLYLVKEKWDMFIIAIAVNLGFVAYYIVWRICRCFVEKTKSVIQVQSLKLLNSLNKPQRLKSMEEEQEDREAISDTIPLI